MSAVPSSPCPNCGAGVRQSVVGTKWTFPAPIGGEWVRVPFRVKQTRCGACRAIYMTPRQAEGAVRTAEQVAARSDRLVRRR